MNFDLMSIRQIVQSLFHTSIKRVRTNVFRPGVANPVSA